MTIVGVLIAVAGTIWILQGMNVIVSASFLPGSQLCSGIGGGGAVLAGGALSWWGWSRR
jgi:hypothetical protein